MAWKTNTEPKIFLFYMLIVHLFLSFSVTVFRIVTLVHCTVWLSIALELSKVLKVIGLRLLIFGRNLMTFFVLGAEEVILLNFPNAAF